MLFEAAARLTGDGHREVGGVREEDDRIHAAVAHGEIENLHGLRVLRPVVLVFAGLFVVDKEALRALPRIPVKPRIWVLLFARADIEAVDVEPETLLAEEQLRNFLRVVACSRDLRPPCGGGAPARNLLLHRGFVNGELDMARVLGFYV